MEYCLARLSNCELLIMLCIWNSEEPVTVHQIQEEMKRYKKDYKETTVYTILKYLKEKGFVTSYKKGTSYFSALVSKEDYRKELQDKIQLLFG